jgi:hypothetical protein
MTRKENAMKKLWSVITVLLLALIACTLTPVSPTAAPVPSQTALPEPTEAISELVIVPRELVAEPTLDPLSFTTVDGQTLSWQDMGHGEQFLPAWRDDYSGIEVTLGEETLVAAEHFDSGQAWVTVTRDGEELYRIEAGMGSPIPALQGFFVYDGAWVLETNFCAEDRPFQGNVIVDGVLLNEQEGYQIAFGAQILAGRLFYFFQKDGHIDAWYDGQVLPLGYDEVPHYHCCSESVINPYPFQEMVAFFGVRDGTWTFVQIGTPAAVTP